MFDGATRLNKNIYYYLKDDGEGNYSRCWLTVRKLAGIKLTSNV
jgi:hypothetical protein